MAQLLVAGLFALAFGTIYVWGTADAIYTAIDCGAKAKLGNPCDKTVTDIPHLSYIINTIGNIISGSIVGILALTRKDELPAQRLIDGDSKDIARRVATYIPLAFIILWVGCGVASVIYGIIEHPEVIPPLTAQAKGWLGSAGTALLAYLAPAPGSISNTPAAPAAPAEPPPLPPASGGTPPLPPQSV